jgi:fermentation-respiration switch protein FrsA (DUF1100 family)
VSVVAWALSQPSTAAAAPVTETVSLRNHPQTVYVYGMRGATPVLLSSGDGGWMHLAPHVAELLASRGYFVVGFDVKQYLSSFTSGSDTLGTTDVPGDYRVLIDFAGRGASSRVVLIGVSEGAGLSLLAATDPPNKLLITGVIGLGLPDINELGWRWQDSMIYITHGAPKEPTFSTVKVAPQLTPVPLAAIHSTTDAYVPLAEAEQVVAHASEPKRMWVIKAGDHSFSDNLPELDARVLEAIAWVAQHHPR